MIIYCEKKNLLNSQATILVNPVNTVGVMGSGLAKGFKDRYPKNYLAYNQYCRSGNYTGGDVFVYQEDKKVIFNIATKINWQNPSKIEWVKKGLIEMRNLVDTQFPFSTAIPKLGCGRGQLNQEHVIDLIVEHFIDCSVPVYIYL